MSVRAAPARQKPREQGPGSFDLAALAGGKPLAAPAAVQAWQISAHYDATAASSVVQQQERQQALPVLPSIRTRPQEAQQAQQLSDGDDAALYAGSPTKASVPPVQQWGSDSAACTTIAQAAGAALPAEALPWRQVSLAAELEDQLVSAEATLQLIAFEADPCQGGGCACSGGVCGGAAQQLLPAQLHFTFRSLGGPAVTPPVRLEPAAGGAGSPGCGGRHLFALVAEGQEPAACDALTAPVHRLPLLDAAGLQQLVCSEGLPPAAAASLARQHRLRVARWLEEGRLQVDVWDNGSLLQVCFGERLSCH